MTFVTNIGPNCGTVNRHQPKFGRNRRIDRVWPIQIEFGLVGVGLGQAQGDLLQEIGTQLQTIPNINEQN